MTTLADRQLALGKYLMTSGTPWPAVSAAASVGNATQENLCFPVTQGPKDHGSDYEWQWRDSVPYDDTLSILDNVRRGARLTGCNEWCKSKGYIITLMESHAEFHKWEIQNIYPSLWRDLTEGTKPLATLTANIMEQYERPATSAGNLDARIRYAHDAFALLVPGAPQPQPAPQARSQAPAPTSVDALLAALQKAKADKAAAQAALTAADAEIQNIKGQLSTIISSL